MKSIIHKIEINKCDSTSLSISKQRLLFCSQGRVINTTNEAELRNPQNKSYFAYEEIYFSFNRAAYNYVDDAY